MIQIHECIAGFTQGTKRWHGVLKLHERMLSELEQTVHCRIWFHRWHDDWVSVAERIWLIRDRYQEPLEVFIYCYSYGGGWGAMRLAEYLDDANIFVNTMVSSDAVFRHPNLLLRWKALTSGPQIKVPRNVRNIYGFYQRKNKPSGHDLVLSGSSRLLQWTKLNYTHQKMDDAPEFHDLSLQVAHAAKLQSAG